MKTIRMLVAVTNPCEHRTYRAGEKYEVHDAVASVWACLGYCEILASPEVKMEAAAIENKMEPAAVENKAKRNGRKKA